MSRIRKIAAAAVLLGLALAAFCQETPIAKTLELGAAPGLITKYCAGCHDWAAGYGTMIAPARIRPGKPDESGALILIEDGSMPPSGPAPTAKERELVRAWIAAGAPAPSREAAGQGRGVPIKTDPVSLHRYSGWASGGLLLAAGVVGAVHANNMMTRAHDYRDAHGIEEFDTALCPPKIREVWKDPGEQALRWTHVGLLVAGESLYLYNAVTGIGFMGPSKAGVEKAKLHRWSFFVHGALMMAEAVLGGLTSDALRRGDHEAVQSLGRAHVAVGFAIPLAIFGSGALMSLK